MSAISETSGKMAQNYARGRAYELQVLKHLIENEGYADAYLWDHCPESLLYKAGLISSWTEYRIRRRTLAQDEMAGHCWRDTGIDIMALTHDGHIDMIQCKGYAQGSTICTEDLAGFFANIGGALIHHPDNRASIFYSGRLSTVVRQHLSLPGYAGKVRAVELPFEYEQEQGPDANSIRNERMLTLWPDQLDAIIAIKQWWESNQSIGYIQAPCGFGKSLVAGHAISWLGEQERSMGVAFTIPLIEQAQRMYDRLQAFASDRYNIILVSSESDRNIPRISAAFQTGRPVLVISTFASADVIRKLPWTGKWLLIIDEFHNMSKADLGIDEQSDLHMLIKMAPKVLGMSATPRIYVLEDSKQDDDITLMGRAIYKMSWSDAIKKNLISQYKIFVPCLSESKDHLNTQLNDIGISDIAKPIHARCDFLLKGMLEHGVRRCIIFLPSGPGTDAEDTAAKYHEMLGHLANWFGIEVYTSTILSGTTKKQRQQRIDAFEHGDVQTRNGRPLIRILLSVRILDESIDIPGCDAVFFTSPSCSKIRTIQRAARCLRQHEGKHPCIFVWCDSSCEEQAELLSALKEMDADLASKVYVMSSQYDKMGQGRSPNTAAEEKDLIQTYIVGIKEYVNPRQTDQDPPVLSEDVPSDPGVVLFPLVGNQPIPFKCSHITHAMIEKLFEHESIDSLLVNLWELIIQDETNFIVRSTNKDSSLSRVKTVNDEWMSLSNADTYFKIGLSVAKKAIELAAEIGTEIPSLLAHDLNNVIHNCQVPLTCKNYTFLEKHKTKYALQRIRETTFHKTKNASWACKARNGVSNQNIQCNTCGEVFSTMQEYQAHKLIAHGEKRAIYLCDKCNHVFEREAALKDHVRSCRSKVDPLICKHCGKTFNHSSSRCRHENACAKQPQ